MLFTSMSMDWSAYLVHVANTFVEYLVLKYRTVKKRRLPLQMRRNRRLTSTIILARIILTRRATSKSPRHESGGTFFKSTDDSAFL
jgi:hypothetical protein